MPDKNESKQETVEEFLDAMVTDKYGTEISPAERLEERLNLRERLDDLVNEEMIVALSDREIIELDRRMSEGISDEELEDFLANSGADFTSAAIAAFDRLRDEYLGLGEGEAGQIDEADQMGEADHTTTDTTTNGEER